MFGLVIQGGKESTILTVGRNVIGPLYYIRRSGRAVRRMAWDGMTPEHGVAGQEKDHARREAYRAEQRELMETGA